MKWETSIRLKSERDVTLSAAGGGMKMVNGREDGEKKLFSLMIQCDFLARSPFLIEIFRTCQLTKAFRGMRNQGCVEKSKSNKKARSFREREWRSHMHARMQRNSRNASTIQSISHLRGQELFPPQLCLPRQKASCKGTHKITYRAYTCCCVAVIPVNPLFSTDLT